VTWNPVSKETFARILSEETGELTPESARTYQRYAIEPYEQQCWRCAEYGIERVFVIAKNGNQLLFFDDVEEEFGVGVPDSDGILKISSTSGPLILAVLALGREQ
jgi:hypothetical protein